MSSLLVTLALGTYGPLALFPLGGCGGNANGAATGGKGSGGTVAGNGGTPGVGSGGAGHGGGGGQGASDDVPEVMNSYKSWTALSDAPVDISAQIASLCRLPTAAENEFVESPHGRHALRDWANTGAAARITTAGSEPFPVGAAIVKEKFVTDPASGEMVLAALGIMVKRTAGFDSASGDWEFIYWNEASGTTRGRAQLSNCTSCHASADAIDFVFVDDAWRTTSSP